MSDEGESKPEQAAKPEAEEESEVKIEEQSISESKVDEKPVESETQSDNQVAKTEENTPSQDFAKAFTQVGLVTMSPLWPPPFLPPAPPPWPPIPSCP